MIGGEPVFLTFAQEGKLRGQVFPNLTDRAGSIIQGHPQAIEFGRRSREILEAAHRADAHAFRQEWVKFDLRGEDARTNVTDLLLDSM